MKRYFVYILTNKRHMVLYTGVTSDISRRVEQHKRKQVGGFSKRYNVDKLVYCELFEDVRDALAREKQIKGGSRQDKLDLINAMNPSWRDPAETL